MHPSAVCVLPSQPSPFDLHLFFSDSALGYNASGTMVSIEHAGILATNRCRSLDYWVFWSTGKHGYARNLAIGALEYPGYRAFRSPQLRDFIRYHQDWILPLVPSRSAGGISCDAPGIPAAPSLPSSAWWLTGVDRSCESLASLSFEIH